MSAPEVTFFLCGKRGCEHDYSVPRESYYPNGNVSAGWLECSKCGASNMDESMWADEAEPAAAPTGKEGA